MENSLKGVKMKKFEIFLMVFVLTGIFSCTKTDINTIPDGFDTTDAVDTVVDSVADIAQDQGAKDVSADIPDTSKAVLWKGPGAPPELKGKFYDAHPAIFSRISHWFTHVKPSDTPDTGHLGAFGIGNGTCFGITGMTLPLNTLHEMIGPVYEKRDGFFGDYWLNIMDAAGKKVGFDEQWAMRSMNAPVTITRANSPKWRLDTIDFAPWTDLDMKNCIIRVVLVTNRGETPSQASVLNIHAFKRTWPQGNGTLIGKSGTRQVVTGILGMKGRTDKRNLDVDIPVLQAGETMEFDMFHCMAEGEPVAPADFDAGALLDRTRQLFKKWDDGLVHVDVPDPLVKDFIDGMKQTLIVQTTSTGANCPMSEYTRVWARDSIGPVLAWLDLGAFDNATSLLDYLYYGIQKGGGLGNSYASDLDITQPVTQPDWDNLPALSGKTGAETPSYMVLEYGLLHRFTGLTERVTKRWGFLKYCLMKQEFGPDHLLPFTGDETFRTIMDSSFGLDLSYSHADKSWSANSSFLWLGAQKAFAAMADAIGNSADKDAAEKLKKDVEAGALKHYLLPDKCFAAYEDRASGKPSLPFEDASLKVLWAGWLDGSDRIAMDSLDCLVKQIETAPGILESPLAPQYKNFHNLKLKKGLYTGMLPGYTLAAMTMTGHSHAMDAFNATRLSLSTSGNLDEVMIFDDHSGLTLVYDQAGAAGDYTAKFRPWEGGIVLDAVMKYLVGFVPDAGKAMIRLRPHLPNQWGHAKYTGLRMGDGRFDLEITKKAPGKIRVEVLSRASFTARLVLKWDCVGTCLDMTDNDQSIKAVTSNGMGTKYMESREITLPSHAGTIIVITD